LARTKPAEVGGEQLNSEQLVDKIRQQHKEIEYLKRQREILKKAMSILGEEPNNGMR
jgi:cell division protein FtsB